MRLILPLVAAFLPGAAAAQPCPSAALGCVTGEMDWHHRNNAVFDDISVDTGFIPAGSPIQLRFQLSFGGGTEVDLGGAPAVWWLPGLLVSVPGRPGTGLLSMDYGYEVAVTLRFDIRVAGIRYRWEGDIPIPTIPDDLRTAADAVFDPFLLVPRDRPVRVRDTTDRFPLVELDLAGGLIPIPGIGGGLRIEMQGDVEATYQTERIEVTDATPIDEEDTATRSYPGGEAVSFGAAKDIGVQPVGTLGHVAHVTFWPTVFIEIVGTTTRFSLAEVPIEVADVSDEVIFDEHPLHVPLPDVHVEPTMLTFPETMVGAEVEDAITIENRGEAALTVSVMSPAAPFALAMAPAELAPGEMGTIAVRYRPEDVGPDAALLLLSTNDPDEPSIAIRLGGTGLGGPDAGAPDAGEQDAGPAPDASAMAPPGSGGCGCRAVGDADGLGWAALLVAVAAWRRRRTHTGR